MNPIKLYQQQEHGKLEQSLSSRFIRPFREELLSLNQQGWQRIFRHGDFIRWSAAFERLPDIQTGDIDLRDSVRVGDEAGCTLPHEQMKAVLKQLMPWRKGPFDVFGVHIDTEWRSEWKWERVKPHISDLQGREVLDIGCGSGYHIWRMVGSGAKLVLGIEPSPLFSFHFATIKRYQPQANAFIIPTGIDELPDEMHSFDTVFSMGILYHRKQPLEHLYKIKSLLKDGGELVLETLVVDGDARTCLVPEDRYGKMRNVWFIPSVAMLEVWLRRTGFKDVHCVDLNQTSVEEQRATEWMQFESLPDFLDSRNPSLTVEGYPAPKRAVIVAKV